MEKDLAEGLVKLMTHEGSVRKSVEALYGLTRDRCAISNSNAQRIAGTDHVPGLSLTVTEVGFAERPQADGPARWEGFWSIDAGPDRIARFTCFVDDKDGLKCTVASGSERTTLYRQHGGWMRRGDRESEHRPMNAQDTIRDLLHDAIERRRIAIGGAN